MPRIRKRYLTMLLGSTLGLVLAFMVLRTTDWATIVTTAQQASMPYMLLAILSLVMVWICRALRFLLLVEPRVGTPFWPYLCSVTISEFVDIAVPLRLGVPVRAFTLKRLRQVPFMQGAAATVVERMMDFFAVLILLIICVLFVLPFGQDVHLPAQLLGTDEPFVLASSRIYFLTMTLILSVLALTAAMFLFWALRNFYGPRLNSLLTLMLPRLGHRMTDAVTSFAHHLNAFSSWPQAAALLVVNILVWLFSLASIGGMFMAFGLPTPLYTPVLTLACIMLSAMLLPTAPGFVGQYHIAIVISLSILSPDIPIELASTGAIFIHMTHFGISVALGLVCLATSHISLRELSDAETLGKEDIAQSDAD